MRTSRTSPLPPRATETSPLAEGASRRPATGPTVKSSRTDGARTLQATDAFERGATVGRRPLRVAQTSTASAFSGSDLDGRYAGGPIVERNGISEPTFYDPNTHSIDSIPPIQPRSGNPNGATLYLTNGIDTPPWLSLDNAQRLADESGASVRMVYNARQNVAGDIVQSAVDLFGPAELNPASRTLGNMIYHKLAANQRVHLVGESQGAIITRNALEIAGERLRKDGLSSEEVKARLGNVVVETFNGAVPGPPISAFPIPEPLKAALTLRRRGYPDGPTYIHYGNPRDEAVFARMGVGQWGGARFGGEDAVIRKVAYGRRLDPIDAHLFRGIVEHRVPWDQAVREGNVDIQVD